MLVMTFDMYIMHFLYVPVVLGGVFAAVSQEES